MAEQREGKDRRHALERLAGALEEFRLTARVVGPDTVTALDSGGLSQSVVLRSCADRVMWCWLWPGRADGDVEAESMVPAEEVEEAARRIRDVISPRRDRTAPGPSRAGRPDGDAGP
jgi:hypothetical protein